MHLLGIITDSSSQDKASVKHSHVALDHRDASILTNNVRVVGVDIVVVDGVLQIEEGHGGVDVNNDQSKQARHRQLRAVYGHTPNNILKCWEPEEAVK